MSNPLSILLNALPIPMANEPGEALPGGDAGLFQVLLEEQLESVAPKEIEAVADGEVEPDEALPEPWLALMPPVPLPPETTPAVASGLMPEPLAPELAPLAPRFAPLLTSPVPLATVSEPEPELKEPAPSSALGAEPLPPQAPLELVDKAALPPVADTDELVPASSGELRAPKVIGLVTSPPFTTQPVPALPARPEGGEQLLAEANDDEVRQTLSVGGKSFPSEAQERVDAGSASPRIHRRLPLDRSPEPPTPNKPTVPEAVTVTEGVPLGPVVLRPLLEDRSGFGTKPTPAVAAMAPRSEVATVLMPELAVKAIPLARGIDASPAGESRVPLETLPVAPSLPEASLGGAFANQLSSLAHAGSNGQIQPAAPQTLALPMAHPQWSEAFASRVVWFMRQDIQHAEIQLAPAELGPIEVKISLAHGEANVVFNAAHASTRDAIEQSLPRLREMLAQQGVHLGQANISGNTDRGHQGDNQGRLWFEAGGDHSLVTTETEMANADSNLARSATSSQAVDFYV